MTLRSGSQFMGNNPTFTLEARTSGGPPTTSTWTRDGVEITSGISLALDTVHQIPETADNVDAYQNSRYISTLVVTGVFPGVYQYSASNRAMASPRTDSFAIEGIFIAVVTGCTKLKFTSILCLLRLHVYLLGGGWGARYLLAVLFLLSRPYNDNMCCMGWEGLYSSFSCLGYAMKCKKGPICAKWSTP